VPGPIDEALRSPGPHTTRSLAERLPAFPEEAIRQALEALAAQGVLERSEGASGEAEYRYTAPERYHQINLDAVRDPGTGIRRRPR
jgi:predicted ArsR family transcriptional regulator